MFVIANRLHGIGSGGPGGGIFAMNVETTDYDDGNGNVNGNDNDNEMDLDNGQMVNSSIQSRDHDYGMNDDQVINSRMQLRDTGGLNDDLNVNRGMRSRGYVNNLDDAGNMNINDQGYGMRMGAGLGMMDMPNMTMGMGMEPGQNLLFQVVLQLQQQQTQQQQNIQAMMSSQQSFQQQMKLDMQQYKQQQRRLYETLLRRINNQQQQSQKQANSENESDSTCNYQAMRIRDIYHLGQAMLIIKESVCNDGNGNGNDKRQRAKELGLLKTLGSQVDLWRDVATNVNNGKLFLKYSYDLQLQFYESDLPLTLPEFQAKYQADPTRHPKLTKTAHKMNVHGYNLGNWKNYANIPENLLKKLFPFTFF